MRKYYRPFILVLACLAAADAPAQNPTPSQPPGYVDEAPLPKGWPKPGPYDQVSEKSYPSYRAAFTTENRDNGAFGTLFSHLQKNDIPMTAPVEIAMAEGDGQNLRQTSLAFLYQDPGVGKTGADGAKVEVRDVPAMKTLSYTWQGDRNDANIAKAKAALEAALKDRKIEAKGFRLLGYNGPGIPELKRTWELQALLRASALATPPVPISGSAPQPPTVAVEMSDKERTAHAQKLAKAELRQVFSELRWPYFPDLLRELPHIGEGGTSETREIRRAVSDLVTLKEGFLGGSIQQIQEKKAALKAAVERGIKKNPSSVLHTLFGFGYLNNQTFSGGRHEKFVHIYPELAVTLLDQVPQGFYRQSLATLIASEWADYELKAALAWANQQTDSEIKSATLMGVISSWGKTDLKAALAYVQSLPPGVLLDRDNTISDAWWKNCEVARGYQGALAMMRSLPEGRDKDLAAEGISTFMSQNHPQAAWDLASGIADSGLRGRAEQRVLISLRFGSLTDPDAASKWMQSLSPGPPKDTLSEIISGPMAVNHPQAAFDIAAGIGDSNRRTQAQKKVVEQWSKKDPAAATQWINRSSLPQEVKTQLLQR
jgi:hypothetical protein